jgi:predicted XRE-type DNA-binding protein
MSKKKSRGDYAAKLADTRITPSSGNVYADLGLDYTEEDMLKVALCHQISDTILNRKLKQSEAAKLMGTDQTKVSLVTRGRIEHFSVARLMEYLRRLGFNVDVRLTKTKAHAPGRLKLQAA